MTLLIDDSDFRLYVGDVREQLRELEAESVHCVVTSPPYWGLRDYGTEGQLGLEATPELFVAAMVDVFREVRRVLRSDGTCWVNLGDSYAGSWGAQSRDETPAGISARQVEAHPKQTRTGSIPPGSGLKPKDLVGIPWRVAFALRADGWYLRSDIIWAKPNPMPESVTDRPTKAHEYVFLLTKSPRYFFDQEAVREPHTSTVLKRRFAEPKERGDSRTWHKEEDWQNPMGRNVRSVWEIATQPYPEAHFATFPEALPERCIKAGTSERGCCPECGAPWERQTDTEYVKSPVHGSGSVVGRHDVTGANNYDGAGMPRLNKNVTTTGWAPTCDHGGDPVPAVCLDPFMGSGTTALVARRLGRRSIGVELNPSYAALCARRLQQLSLFAGEPEPTPTLAPRRGLTGGAYSPPGQSPHSNARPKR